MNNQYKKCVDNSCSKLWNDLSEVRKHVLNAQKEVLLAVRAGLDLVLEKTECHSSSFGQAQKVTVK